MTLESEFDYKYFYNSNKHIVLEASSEDLSEAHWKLYLNNYPILNSVKLNSHLNIWKEPLEIILKPNKILRVLIVGGGNQFLSNYILTFPSKITIVDPFAYNYLEEPFKQVLFAKEYVNRIDKIDGLIRHMVLIDETLENAYKDESILDGEFDLIVVDNYIDNFIHKSGMFDSHIPQIYFNLLKKEGFLVCNNRFYLKKLTKSTLISYPTSSVAFFKGNNKYYKEYMNNINSLLCETDIILKDKQRISVYCKTETNLDV